MIYPSDSVPLFLLQRIFGVQPRLKLLMYLFVIFNKNDTFQLFKTEFNFELPVSWKWNVNLILLIKISKDFFFLFLSFPCWHHNETCLQLLQPIRIHLGQLLAPESKGRENIQLDQHQFLAELSEFNPDSPRFWTCRFLLQVRVTQELKHTHGEQLSRLHVKHQTECDLLEDLRWANGTPYEVHLLKQMLMERALSLPLKHELITIRNGERMFCTPRSPRTGCHCGVEGWQQCFYFDFFGFVFSFLIF